MNIFDWRLWISEDFLKTLKVKKLVWPWRLGNHSRNMEHEDFRCRTFIFSFLSHRKHRTVKGGRGNTKEKFPSDAQLKSYTYQSLRVKPLEISYSSVNFLSDKDEVLLVSEEFVLTKELGICQCRLPTSEEHDSPEEFDSQISDHCCAMCQLSQNIYPPNGHIIEGHLCLIMSGCSLGYK